MKDDIASDQLPSTASAMTEQGNHIRECSEERASRIELRLEQIQQQLSELVPMLQDAVIENRSLLADVEIRQHGAASQADQLVGRMQDAEQRELSIQRTLVTLPDLIREIVVDEINRMDGYNRYALRRQLEEIKKAMPTSRGG